jgi:hypothetical protein
MEENNQQEVPKQEHPKNKQKDMKGALAHFEAFLDEYLVRKAPFALPMGAKEFIVKVAPYLIIIFAILAIPAILAAIGLSAFATPFAMMGGYGYSWGYSVMISLIISVIVLVMEVIAVPGLFKRTKGGWNLVFYASIVSLIGSIISINGIISGIIGAIIGWYILFQVKDLYKN